MSSGFHRLRVLHTKTESKQAVSVMFEVPPRLKEKFRWSAGQHITVRFAMDGSEARRSYSISDAPEGGVPLRITVKRVKDGLVSNHINDHISTGDYVDAMPPQGSFRLDPDPRARRTYYLFGAGSGITPLYAMIRSILASEPHSVALLAYGNANAGSVIFREDLAKMEAGSGGRLTVRHVLSSPSGMSSFKYWRRGRIDDSCVAQFIAEHPPYAQDAQYYVCGPGGMNYTVGAALAELDVPPSRIHTESYGAAEPPDNSVAGVDAEARVRIDGGTIEVSVAAGRTLLDAVRAAGRTPPYSCESGVCGTCRARLLEGKVHMRARMALGDDEADRGFILTCQAIPTTPRLAIDYD